MNGYFLTGIVACAVGVLLGGSTMHYTFDAAKLSAEKVSHAHDNEANSAKLKAVSDAALEAQNKAIAAGREAAGKIASLDLQFQQEKEAHEADNRKNNAAIADGSRRLRVAVSRYTASGSHPASAGTAASGVGDAASGYADLSPAFGLALYAIADDADAERGKVAYLQSYIQTLEEQGLIASPK